MYILRSFKHMQKLICLRCMRN